MRSMRMSDSGESDGEERSILMEADGKQEDQRQVQSD